MSAFNVAENIEKLLFDEEEADLYFVWNGDRSTGPIIYDRYKFRDYKKIMIPAHKNMVFSTAPYFK